MQLVSMPHEDPGGDGKNAAWCWRQSRWAGTALRWPSSCILFMRAGVMMSCRKRSCCSSSSARRVGPGWLQRMSKRMRVISGGADVLQELEVLGVLEVLQVVEVGDKVGPVKVLLGGQVIEIDRVGEALDELGRVNAAETKRGHDVGGRAGAPRVRAQSASSRPAAGRLRRARRRRRRRRRPCCECEAAATATAAEGAGAGCGSGRTRGGAWQGLPRRREWAGS